MLGEVPIINQTLDTSKQEAVNYKLRHLHDTILGDIERNDAKYDIFLRRTEGDTLLQGAEQFLIKDQAKRDKAGGPTIKREKFQPSYWSKWNQDKNILEGESAREVAQQQREDPELVKLRRKKLAHQRMKETRRLAEKEFRTKPIISHSFDAPGKGGTFELPPIGQVANVDHDQVFVDYVFRNSLKYDDPYSDTTAAPTKSTEVNHHRPSSHNGSSKSVVLKTIGGALTQAPRTLGAKICTDTSGCDIPPLPSAMEKAEEMRPVNTFGSAPRFLNSTNQSASGAMMVSSSTPALPAGQKTVSNMGHTFGVALRFPELEKPASSTQEDSNNRPNSSGNGSNPDESHASANMTTLSVPDGRSTPGPGYYTVSRLFDPPVNPLARHQTKKLTEAYETVDLLHEKQQIMRRVHYGFQCHIHDHVRFGLCGVPGTASGAQKPSYDHDDQSHQDSEHSSRSLGVTLLPSMCHCCHHTHFDTRRLRDPKLVRQVKEDIARELQAEEDAKRAAQEAEDLLLGRHLRPSVVMVTSDNTSELGANSEYHDNSTQNPVNNTVSKNAVPTNSSASISAASSHTHSQAKSTTSSRDITQFYSNRKKQEIQKAIVAKEQALKRVREDDQFLAAVDEAGLIPRPIYELTALMTAALKDDIEAIRIMAQNFVDPNERQPETLQTALHHAAHANKVRATQAILHYFRLDYQVKYRKFSTDNIQRFPLQVNLRDHQGDTPLHIACRAGHIEVVEALTSDERCRPALAPTTASQDRLEWLNFIISGGKADKGDDSAAENQRNHRGEFETDLCYHYHNRNIGHRMWQFVHAAVLRKQQQKDTQKTTSSTATLDKTATTTATSNTSKVPVGSKKKTTKT